MKDWLGLALVICVLSAGSVSAHDMWLERENGDLVLRYGHIESGHEGEKTIAYPPEHVMRVDCFDVHGSPSDAIVTASYPVRISGSCAVTHVLLSSGYWSRTPFGTRNQAKDEAKSPLESWLSYESVKRIDAWTDSLTAPLTRDFELTPLRDPLSVGKGKKVRLIATLRGEPVVGATVTYDGKVRGGSDEEGQINIRLKHGGRQIIQAGFEEAGDGTKADKVKYMTTLVFDIGSGE